MAAPWRDAFDFSNSPYDARNALSVPEEVISDGKTYVRKNRIWVDIHSAVIPFLGVTDGSSAAAGDIGEVQSGAQGTPQTLTTATTLSLASLGSLPAGDWDIMGAIGFTGNVATNVTALVADISTTANTLSNNIDHTIAMTVAGTPFNTLASLWMHTPWFPTSNAGTVTYFVNAHALFTVSTCQATGKIWARRRR